MHEMPDTEGADAASERLWPEGYKQRIRHVVTQRVVDSLSEAGAFEQVYESHYTAALESYPSFVERLAEIVTIGAENGTDGAFGEIHSAMRNGRDLPFARVRARYLWPQPFDEDLKTELRGEITAEYRESHALEHLHEDHYLGKLGFKDFIDRAAKLLVVGGINGADDSLAAVYRALLDGSPLPMARRRPRRIQ
jgi:hypothetical protein